MISVLNNNTKKSVASAEPAQTIFIIPLQPWAYTNDCKADMPSRNFYLNSIHQQRCTDGNLMLGNVRCRYPEAAPFMIPPNLLLPNLPHSPEYKGKPEYGQHSYQFEHSQNHRCVPFEGTISFRWKFLTNG